MIPYLMLLFLPLGMSLAKCKGVVNIDGFVAKKDTRILSFFFLFFLLLLCFRGIECGNDLPDYLYITNRNVGIGYDRMLQYYNSEWGYHIFNKFIYSLFDSYQFFIAIVAIVSLVPIWLFYKRECVIESVAIVLFLTVAPFSMYFSGLRQVIAMAFTIPAFYLAKNKKILGFILVVLLASLFHVSAFVMVGILPMCMLKVSKRWLWFVVPIMATIFLFNTQIFSFLMIRFGESYSRYTMAPTGAIGTLLILIIMAIISYAFVDEKKVDDTTSALRNILLLSICLQCFAPVQNVAMRLNYYYLTFVPVLMSRVFLCFKDNYKKLGNIIVVGTVVMFSAYFLYRAFFGADIMKIFPYVPMWRS